MIGNGNGNGNGDEPMGGPPVRFGESIRAEGPSGRGGEGREDSVGPNGCKSSEPG